MRLWKQITVFWNTLDRLAGSCLNPLAFRQASLPKAMGGLGGVTFAAQLAGTLLGVAIALVAGFIVYGGLKVVMGIRLEAEEEFEGADLSIHKISATPGAGEE